VSEQSSAARSRTRNLAWFPLQQWIGQRQRTQHQTRKNRSIRLRAGTNHPSRAVRRGDGLLSSKFIEECQLWSSQL